MKKVKRILSAICSLAIALSMSINAFATDSSNSDKKQEQKSSAISSVDSSDSSNSSDDSSSQTDSQSEKNTSSSSSSSENKSDSAADSSQKEQDEIDKKELTKMIGEYLKQETKKAVPDYENDSSYDTKGNASIVKEKKIIHDSSEMQFISVTTKDGHIFYILIDYTSIKKGDVEESVYFLNKVDDYDLYALLNSGDSEDNGRVTGKTDNESENTDDSSKKDSSKTEKTEKKSTTPNSAVSTSSFVFVGVLIVGAIVFVLFLKKKGSNKKIVDDDDDLDFEDDEDSNDNDNDNF